MTFAFLHLDAEVVFGASSDKVAFFEATFYFAYKKVMSP